MIYLTYNDSPSGIYNSQVIDVVNYLQKISKEKVILISLISLRNFYVNKRWIKSRCTTAIVLPMFPKVRFWKANMITLFIILLLGNHKTLMARGPFAAYLGLRLKKIKLCNKIIFDARGAYYAELNEYNVVDDDKIRNDIKNIENFVLSQCDYRLAVSKSLVTYWKTNYHYNGTKHVVIPCTLGNDFLNAFPSEQQLLNLRSKHGFEKNDILFVYSGSTAGWQSFNLIDEVMLEILKISATRLIVLSNDFDKDLKIMQLYSEKINIAFVKPNEVKEYLYMCDYGIIYREQSITNKVASPVKFAEYLSCGLKVLISENLGDYSELVKKENIAFDENNIDNVSYAEKTRINNISKLLFVKETYKEHYLTLLS